MAAKAIEIILRDQFPRRLQILLRQFGIFKMGVRAVNVGKTVEESNQHVIILAGKTEGRHSELEPRANRNRRLEKPEQRRRLHLLPFPVEDRRTESRTLLIV